MMTPPPLILLGAMLEHTAPCTHAPLNRDTKRQTDGEITTPSPLKLHTGAVGKTYCTHPQNE